MSKLNKNLIIPTRFILNFIYKILVPSEGACKLCNLDLNTFLAHSLPELIFTNIPQNKILKPIQELDVMNSRLAELDAVISKLFVSKISEICDEYFKSSEHEVFVNNLIRLEHETDNLNIQNAAIYIRTISRMIWLSQSIELKGYYESYLAYTRYLEGYNSGNPDRIQELVDFVHKAIYLWIGDGESTYIRNQRTKNIYMCFQIDIEDAFEELPKRDDNTSIYTSMVIPFRETESNIISEVEIDYSIFKLLYAINNGYHPNTDDENNAISFVNFMNSLVKSGQNKVELLLSTDANSEKFVLKKKKKIGQDVYEFGRKF